MLKHIFKEYEPEPTSYSSKGLSRVFHRLEMLSINVFSQEFIILSAERMQLILQFTRKEPLPHPPPQNKKLRTAFMVGGLFKKCILFQWCIILQQLLF